MQYPSMSAQAGHAAVRAQLLQHLRYMTNLLYRPRHLTNFRGLVLGCIEAKFCK